MLTNISLDVDQSTHSYLGSIKTITDGLMTIQSPISDIELIQFTTARSPEGYDFYVTTFPLLVRSTSFDGLCSKLLFYEQYLNHKKDHFSPCIKPLLLHWGYPATRV